VFGKLFGRGRPELDAFGVEMSSTAVSVPSNENVTTTVTTTSSRMPEVAGLDLGALLGTVRQVQQQAGGDREAMAKLLREQLGSSSVFVGQEGASAFDGSAMQHHEQDPIELLATLTELHDKGVVSDEQFEEQKRRLLG
jgi:hypothetical protein